MPKSRLRSYKQKNERRLHLIDKEYRSKLTKAEKVELKELMIWCGNWINERHPLPEIKD